MSEAASGVSQGEDVIKSKDPTVYLLSVAIDIGTSSSCYAYSFNTNEQIHLSKFKESSQDDTTGFKAPTSVLTKPGPNGEFVSFGYKAEKDYVDKLAENPDTKYHLYQDFKMELYRKMSKNTDCDVVGIDYPDYENQNIIMTESLDGTKRPLKDIYVMVLSALVKHMDTARELGGHSVVPKNRIRWVLCVPATWTERAKYFIRRAACEAGLIDDPLSDQLHILLESTAAGIFCHLPTTRFSMKHTERNEVPTGTKYLVIDAGAGTADLAAQMVVEGKRKAVVEIEVGNGGDWGSRHGDKVFIKNLGELVGETLFKQFKAKHPADWFEIQLNFDRAKSSVEPGEENIVMALPPLFVEFMSEHGKKLWDIIDLQGASYGFSEMRRKLRINKDTIDSYYQPVIEKIVDSAVTMLKGKRLKDSDLREIFLVGGFGHSERLQACIKDACHNRRISVPTDAKAAVIKGAIQYALNPSIITFIATKTYGIGTYSKFDAQKHDKRKKVTISGETLCKDLFIPFINKNEPIRPDVIGHACVNPVDSEATFVDVEFYSMDRAKLPDEVIYTDKLEVRNHIRVPMSKTEGGCQREIFLTFSFGDEIRIKASDMDSEEVIHCEIMFGHEKHVEEVL